MEAGICSIIRSRPGKVRRSLSDTSLDVCGSIVAEKVWMFDNQIKDDDSWTEIEAGGDELCRQHLWSIFTNLCTAQFCVKCRKTVRTRRAAYKCMECKRLCHLKCVAQYEEETWTASDRQLQWKQDNIPHTPVKHRNTLKDQSPWKPGLSYKPEAPVSSPCNVSTRRREGKDGTKSPGLPVSCKVTQEVWDERADVYPPSIGTDVVDSGENDFKHNFAECSTQTFNANTSIQSQAKETLNSMKHSIVKRCRSIKKKVGKLKENWPAKFQSEDNTDNAQSSSRHCCLPSDKQSSKMTEDEKAEEEKAAWVRSPVRLRSGQRGKPTHATRRRVPENGSQKPVQKRGTKRRYYLGGSDRSFDLIRDRLDSVETKVKRLEISIADEVKKWKKLTVTFGEDQEVSPQLTDQKSTSRNVGETEAVVEEQDQATGSSSRTTSEEACGTIGSGQETSSSCHDNGTGHLINDCGLLGNHDESLLQSMDVPTRPRLDLNGNVSAGFEHQTSTPVTDREMSFRSASRNYRISQLAMTSVTSVKVDNSVAEFNELEKQCQLEAEKEASKSNEASGAEKTLSPHKAAINLFLQRRSSPRDKPTLTGSPTIMGSGATVREQTATQSGVCASPGSSSCPVASSTFQNGRNGLMNMDMSPVSFTFRNDTGDPDFSLSYAQMLEHEDSKAEKREAIDSVLSYTFRNDSSMCQTNNEEMLRELYQDHEDMVEQEEPITRLRTEVTLQQRGDDCCSVTAPKAELGGDFQDRLECDGASRLSKTSATTTTETLSLTNVTEFTEDGPNSFTEDIHLRLGPHQLLPNTMHLQNITQRKVVNIRDSRPPHCAVGSSTVEKTPTPADIDTGNSAEQFPVCGKSGDTGSTSQKYCDNQDFINETGDCRLPQTLQVSSATQLSEDKLTYKPPPVRKAGSVVSIDGSMGTEVHSTQTDLSTPSLQRPRNDSKYHFLNAQSMIKIVSPKLDLLFESPGKGLNADGYLSSVTETSLETDSESRRASGASGHGKSSDMESGLTNINTLDPASTCSLQGTVDSGEKQGQLEQQILEECMNIVDAGEKNWDTVLQWMNQGCTAEEAEGMEKHLDRLGSGNEEEASIKGSSLPNEDSVYYSFQGQSEEIRTLLSLQSPGKAAGDEHEMCGLLDLVRSGQIEEVKELLNSDTTISEYEIKEAVNWTLKQKDRPLANLILDDICQLIRASEVDEVVDVWPGYRKENPWQPLFVVLTKNIHVAEWDTFMNFDVLRRRYDLVSKEAARVINSKEVRDNPLSLDDFEKVRNAIESGHLDQQHSKITIINACPCKSRDEGNNITKELCIVVHCLVKGIIPFDEDPFPETLQGLPVDVREGYFTIGVRTPPESPKPWENDTSPSEDSGSGLSGTSMDELSLQESGSATESASSLSLGGGSCDVEDEEIDVKIHCGPGGDADNCNGPHQGNDTMNYTLSPTTGDSGTGLQVGRRSTDYNETLLAGSGIGLAEGNSRGTIGGFVFLQDGSVGLLTNAHVVDGSEGSLVTQPAETDIPHGCDTQRPTCGKVVKAVFDPGAVDRVGVDAALIQVTDRLPQTGEFIWVKKEQITSAGFDTDSPPIFNEGKIIKMKDLTPRTRHQDLIKVGSETGLTRGSLYVPGVYVRLFDTLMETPGQAGSIEFFNQLEVLSNGSTQFFSLGDSGSLVFMPLNGSDLHCIGLAIGSTEYGSCIVTPIESVFERLNLPAGFIDFTAL